MTYLKDFRFERLICIFYIFILSIKIYASILLYY